jgi:hypothetical protein
VLSWYQANKYAELIMSTPNPNTGKLGVCNAFECKWFKFKFQCDHHQSLVCKSQCYYQYCNPVVATRFLPSCHGINLQNTSQHQFGTAGLAILFSHNNHFDTITCVVVHRATVMGSYQQGAWWPRTRTVITTPLLVLHGTPSYGALLPLPAWGESYSIYRSAA